MVRLNPVSNEYVSSVMLNIERCLQGWQRICTPHGVESDVDKSWRVQNSEAVDLLTGKCVNGPRTVQVVNFNAFTDPLLVVGDRCK